MTDQATDESMRARWDRFATDDPMYYIATRKGRWSDTEFFSSGQSLVDRVLKWLGPDVPRRRMLEIGCGLGRTSVHFAAAFDRVDAIDVSPAMIEQARDLNPPENIRFAVASGSDLQQFDDGRFDLVASFLVFQHIPDFAIVRGYLQEIARVLADDGVAVLQFDTRPEPLMLRLYKSLPDPLLPKTHRRFIRRYRRDGSAVREAMREAGLTVTDEHQRDSSEHFFVLGLTASTEAADA